MKPDFWTGKKVFLTGHTGFKGSWLTLILNRFGAKVTGYSVDIPTKPSLFEVCALEKKTKTIWADVRDAGKLKTALAKSKPDIVIHMAAQPLVRRSYADPIETYQVNVMGTANLLEGVRQAKAGQAVLVVTTDKVYANKERSAGYEEHEPLGGHDPYSNSKACAELVTQAYRGSFSLGVASARAGNVIGGGDWAQDRLIPDVVAALTKKKPLVIRYPHAIRPWQHVLDPLRGYLMLIEKLCEDKKYGDAWNFGPVEEDSQSVRDVVEYLIHRWGEKVSWKIDDKTQPHEAGILKLNCGKAQKCLGWTPQWRLKKALDEIIRWTRAYKAGDDMRKVTLAQIDEFYGN